MQISLNRENLQVSDPNLSENARNLFFNLADLTDQVLFGHQDTNFYGLNATNMSLWSDWDNFTNSDVLTLTGSYPAVYGFDVFSSAGYIVPGIKAAFECGGVITVSWHAPNFVTGGSFYDTSGDVVSKILPGGTHHSNFTAVLDDIALNLGNLEHLGQDVPIIFRPWHEYNGNWFWWGSRFCSRQDFKALYRFTVEYLRDTKGVQNFLYAFSPNQMQLPFTSSSYLSRYPGDDVVDILALDAYDLGFGSWKYNIEKSLETIIKIAMERGKLVAFSETGLSGGLSKTDVSNWYSDVLLEILLSNEDIRNVAYVMVWRNANYGHFWVPYPGHPQEAGFLEFFNNKHTVFENNLPSMYADKTSAGNYNESAQTILRISNIGSIIGLVLISSLIITFGYHLVLEIKSIQRKKPD